MAKLKTLSGNDLVGIFRKFGFSTRSQNGSHVKLRRETSTGRQTLIIAMHRQIDKGTLAAIYGQACCYIPEAELRRYFFSE